jgi:hypothetical protein
MSRTLSTPFKKIFYDFCNEVHPSISIISGGLLVGGHMAYTYGTTQNKIIVINKKYQFTRNGFTEFMIVDNKGDHYNINNSVWYWKWNSIEDWVKLDTNNEIHIKYYGYRIPFLGIFPNIISNNHSKLPDPKVISQYKEIEYTSNKQKQCGDEFIFS